MARTESAWEEVNGSYLQTKWAEGRNILINGTNKYLNFGTISGLSGYGFRDNGGTIEFKNSGGSWQAIGTGSGGGGGSEWVVVSSSRTAVLDEQYSNVANATYTDPTPVEGKGFVVLVRNGTATVGGIGYLTAGTLIYRVFHSGAWANYVYQVSSTFALASHTHAIADVTGLQTALDGKAPTSHTHTASQITDFDTAVAANSAVAANTAARHDAATVLDSTSIDMIISGQQISAQREALTGDIAAPKNSNTTTAQSALVTGKATVTPESGDFVLISDTSDSGALKKVDASNFLGGGGGGSGEATEVSITQSSHGFSVGNALKKTGASYALAQADSAANAEVVGIVSAVADANTFTLLTGGYIDTLTGLTANTTYFLSDATAGLLTTTEPTAVGAISKPLLNTVSTTAGVFTNMRGMVMVGATDGQTSAHVMHGSVASTARPSVDYVIWTGSVEPTNMADNDIWNEVA
jgi:Phage tail repeat like